MLVSMLQVRAEFQWMRMYAAWKRSNLHVEHTTKYQDLSYTNLLPHVLDTMSDCSYHCHTRSRLHGEDGPHNQDVYIYHQTASSSDKPHNHQLKSQRFSSGHIHSPFSLWLSELVRKNNGTFNQPRSTVSSTITINK